MTDTLEAAIPDAEETIQETAKTPEQRHQDLLSERISRALEPQDESEPEAQDPEDSEEVEEDIEVESPEEAEELDEEVEEEEEEESVPSQDGEFDIDELGEDELEALTSQINAKAGKALTKARLQEKERKAEIEYLKSQLEEFSTKVASSITPLGHIRSEQEAEEAIKQTEVNIKGWNRKLITERVQKYDDKTGDEIDGVEFDGKFMPVKELLSYIDREESKLEPLRNRQKEIREISQNLGDPIEKIAEVRGKLGIEDDSEEAEEYIKLLKNPKFEMVANIIPEYANELIEVFGRASKVKTPSTKKFKGKLKRKSPKAKTESVSLGSKSARPAERSKSTNVKVKQLQKIVNDPKRSITERRNADQQIRIIKAQ
jgi:hypothetical protein